MLKTPISKPLKWPEKPRLIKPTTAPYQNRYLVQQVDWDEVQKVIEKHVGEYLKKVSSL